MSVAFASVPPGGAATATTTGVSGTFVLADGSTAPGTLSLAQFSAPPVPENIVKSAFPKEIVTSTGQVEPLVLSFFDVRATGATPGSTLTVTLHYSDTGIGIPELDFFDPTTGTFATVQGSKPSIVDPTAHTLQVEFTDTSNPAIGNLGGTVFTIAVAAAPVDTTSTPTATVGASTSAPTPTFSTTTTTVTGLLASTAVSSSFGQSVTLQTNETVSVTVVSRQDSSSTASALKGNATSSGGTDSDEGGEAAKKDTKENKPDDKTLEDSMMNSPSEKGPDSPGDKESMGDRGDGKQTELPNRNSDLDAGPHGLGEAVSERADAQADHGWSNTVQDAAPIRDVQAATDESVLQLGGMCLVVVSGPMLTAEDTEVRRGKDKKPMRN